VGRWLKMAGFRSRLIPHMQCRCDIPDLQLEE